MIHEPGLIEVRVRFCEPTGDVQLLESETFVTPSAPHEGDFYNLQGETCIVTNVEWFIVDHQPSLTIWIDPEE
jgi:hypothetical protein